MKKTTLLLLISFLCVNLQAQSIRLVEQQKDSVNDMQENIVRTDSILISNGVEYTSMLRKKNPQQGLSVQIRGTMITNGKLAIDTQCPIQMQVYNMLGQEVKSASLASGLNTFDVSDLSAQVYLLRFYNAQGETKTQKVIIE